MRNRIVIGNWKMNTTIDEAKSLVEDLLQELKDEKTVLCVPYTHISILKEMLPNRIAIGAQNVSNHEKGAYTGDVSISMLKSVGASNVIVGHSERRAYHKESNELVNKKTKIVLEANLTPIVCFGELLELRKQGNHLNFIKNQVLEAIKGLSQEDIKNCILAYEPVWAIGTGESATPEQAQEVHAYIRQFLAEIYTEEVANNVTIIYGGSVKANNASSLFSKKDIDGALVGGASLLAADFAKIIKSL